MKSNEVNENMVMGVTTASSIATSMQTNKTPLKKQSLISFMTNFKKKLKNSLEYKPVKPFPISERFDMNDMFSRLSNIQKSGKDKRDTVTYGVEDDEKNVMRVTVSKNDAVDFESRLAQELSDREDFRKKGFNTTSVSMAELLFNLKNEFDIIDVEFPEIPHDVVYNVDKAQYNTPDSLKNQNTDIISPSELNTGARDDHEIDWESDNDDFSDESGSEGDIDWEGDESTDDELVDDDRVEDFEEPSTTPPDDQSILSSVLAMLKAQAEAEKAKADAEAEKARALQAEYSAKAAQATIAQQEELVRMEADIEQQKRKEKDARRLADIARHRVSKSTGMVQENLTMSDQQSGNAATISMLGKQKVQITAEYAVLPNDPPEVKNYKNQQKALALRELNVKMARARLAMMNNKNSPVDNQQNNNQQNTNNQNGQT